MKTIKCSNHNSHLIVDDEDFERVSSLKWYRVKDHHSKTYIRYQTISKVDGKRKCFPIHRFILNFPKGLIDHINRKTYDNRKENLRITDNLVNSSNCKMHSTNVTGYRGVHAYRKRFVAQINSNNKKIHLGVFDTAVEAAIAYDNAIDILRNGIGVKNFGGEYA